MVDPKKIGDFPEEEFASGDLVYLRRTLLEPVPEILTVLWELPNEQDEPEDQIKYLTRTAAHSKKVVFDCEIISVEEAHKRFGDMHSSVLLRTS